MVAETTVEQRPIGTGTLLLLMGVFVVVGAPLVYLLWSVVNDILTGHIVRLHLALAAPALIVFVVVLNLLARSIRRWDGRAA